MACLCTAGRSIVDQESEFALSLPQHAPVKSSGGGEHHQTGQSDGQQPLVAQKAEKKGEGKHAGSQA